MASIHPRWKIILAGICGFVLACLLLLTVSGATFRMGPLYGDADAKYQSLVLSPVAPRSAPVYLSKWGNESRYGYTPLAAPTHAVTPTDNRVETRNRYVMSLSYWEELTMATNSWMQLALFAKYWGAYCIRPFTANSHLYGLPRPGVYSVDLIYDPEELDHKLEEYSMPPMADYHEFIAKASRDVILLRIDYRQHKQHINTCKGNRDGIVAHALASLNKDANSRGYPNFRLYNCCQVHGQHLTHPDDIARGCGFDQLNQYTVITPEWRGFTHVLSYRLLTTISDISHPNYDYDIYPHSQEVIGNATAFINEVTGGEDYIAMHYRLESFLIRQNPQLTQHCLDYVPKETRRIQREYPHIKHLLLFGDQEFSQARSVGKFQMKEAVSHFPMGRFGSINDVGFAAQVEQNIMSRARILLTAGCGSFQAETVSRFQREPGHLKRYHVCNCIED